MTPLPGVLPAELDQLPIRRPRRGGLGDRVVRDPSPVAVMSTVAIEHAETLLAEGDSPPVAFTDGFQWGFWVGFAIWVAALAGALAFVRREELQVEEALAPSP